VQASYAAALAKYKAATFTDSLSDEELAAAQSRFNEGMKLFNRGSLDNALVIFDEVGWQAGSTEKANWAVCQPWSVEDKPFCCLMVHSLKCCLRVCRCGPRFP
jgi:hypothetical protein